MLGFRAGDALASLVICVIILKVAFDVLKDALSNLTDTACDTAFEHEIADVVKGIPGVIRIDNLRTRKFGNKVYVDVEIAVDGSQTLSQAHEIAESAHNSVESRFDTVKHIMIHENPA